MWGHFLGAGWHPIGDRPGTAGCSPSCAGEVSQGEKTRGGVHTVNDAITAARDHQHGVVRACLLTVSFSSTLLGVAGRAAMAASSSGAQPPPPGGVSLSHLHSSSSLPLLPGFSSSLPLPHPLLDFGVRGAPVWPVQGSQPDGAAGQGWKMANARGQEACGETASNCGCRTRALITHSRCISRCRSCSSLRCESDRLSPPSIAIDPSLDVRRVLLSHSLFERRCSSFRRGQCGCGGAECGRAVQGQEKGRWIIDARCSFVIAVGCPCIRFRRSHGGRR